MLVIHENRNLAPEVQLKLSMTVTSSGRQDLSLITGKKRPFHHVFLEISVSPPAPQMATYIRGLWELPTPKRNSTWNISEPNVKPDSRMQLMCLGEPSSSPCVLSQCFCSKEGQEHLQGLESSPLSPAVNQKGVITPTPPHSEDLIMHARHSGS